MNILIIGATSGIGNGLWRHYAIAGNKVGVIGRREHLLEQMKKDRPKYTYAYKADVTHIDEIMSGIGNIFSIFGSVDLVIICAGTGEINSELVLERELDTIKTNVVGWTAAVDCVYKLFERQGCGHLVTITSIGGLTGEPSAPAYSATKAYQINYTNALRKKSGKTNIQITEVRPGLVDTAMAKGENLFWVMPVDKVVKQVVDAISRKKSKIIVTKRWSIVNFILKYFYY